MLYYGFFGIWLLLFDVDVGDCGFVWCCGVWSVCWCGDCVCVDVVEFFVYVGFFCGVFG